MKAREMKSLIEKDGGYLSRQKGKSQAAHAGSEMGSAIQFHIGGLREEGLPIPDAVSEPEMMMVSLS